MTPREGRPGPGAARPAFPVDAVPREAGSGTRVPLNRSRLAGSSGSAPRALDPADRNLHRPLRTTPRVPWTDTIHRTNASVDRQSSLPAGIRIPASISHTFPATATDSRRSRAPRGRRSGLAARRDPHLAPESPESGGMSCRKGCSFPPRGGQVRPAGARRPGNHGTRGSERHPRRARIRHEHLAQSEGQR